VAEVLTGIWIEAAQKTEPLPKTYCRELVLWLFRLPEIFDNTTGVAIAWCVDGSMRTMGLPISAVIVGNVHVKRALGLSLMLAGDIDDARLSMLDELRLHLHC
jgi:hypothetical protein